MKNTTRTTLEKVRKEKGYTQEKLAQKAGITRAYLANLESGKNYSPSLKVAKRLSELLGKSVDDLF